MLFIGVGSKLRDIIWLCALGHAPTSQVTVFLSLSPVMAVLLGRVVLGEAVSPTMLSGLPCLAAGLWLTSR